MICLRLSNAVFVSVYIAFKLYIVHIFKGRDGVNKKRQYLLHY